MFDNQLLITMLLASTVVGLGCSTNLEKTVPGPESEKLVPGTAGYILTNVVPDGITAIQLSTLQQSIVRSAGPTGTNNTPTIHALSGPDTQGRIAYIEDHFFVPDERQRRHLLKTIQLDGKQDTEVFSRLGDAMWAKSPAGKGEIGSYLALSPRLGRVAFLSELVPLQMPATLLHEGTVEIWDIEKKTGSQIGVKALDNGLSWFPDGTRLAYVKLVDPQTVGNANRETDTFGKTFEGLGKVPAVFLWDVEAGTESPFHLGWQPIVSGDGRSVLVSDWEGDWKQVDVATGKSTAVTWAGVVRPGVIAQLATDVVLSWCLPTQGTTIKYTEHNSPLSGPNQMMALKLARLNSAEFQTVVPQIAPRRLVSFGEVVKKNAD